MGTDERRAMSQLGEPLERFRHAATPGPPAAEAAAIRDAGARDAERIRDEARQQAARLRVLAPGEDPGDGEARAILAAAEVEADGIRRRARGPRRMGGPAAAHGPGSRGPLGPTAAPVRMRASGWR